MVQGTRIQQAARLGRSPMYTCGTKFDANALNSYLFSRVLFKLTSRAGELSLEKYELNFDKIANVTSEPINQ